MRSSGSIRCATAERRKASARLRAMAAHPSAARFRLRCPGCGRAMSSCPGCDSNRSA